jgi:hypothetical protein
LRAKARYRDQSGNILVMFAIMLPVFMLGAAIVVDVGYWWANGRKAQIAADACALAAARDLPQTWNRTECVHGGRDYVVTNLPAQSADSEPVHVSTTVISPFEGDSTLVEATVKMKVRTFFGRYVGLGGVELTRRAVAEQSVGEGNYAIYAHNNGCPTNGSGTSLIFNGEHHTINGRVHANGEYRINNGDGTPPAEPFWAQNGTIGEPQCLVINTSPPNGAHFGGSSYASSTATAPTPGPQQVWPAWWTPSDFGWVDTLDALDTCDVKAKGIKIEANGAGTRIVLDSPIGAQPPLTSSGATLPAYVYCAWEKFEINRDNLVATMTVLSPEITVDGNGQRLTAYKGTASGDMLFFAVPNISNAFDGTLAGGGNPICSPAAKDAKTLTLNGNDHQWAGVIFAPCARVKVNVGGTTAGNVDMTGTILANEVEINGPDFNMVGKSKFGGTVSLALDQ